VVRSTFSARLTPSAGLLLAVPLLLAFQGDSVPVRPDRFTPVHKLSGIGVEREGMPDDVLAIRTDLMIDSQTFAIMRDAQSVPGAQRISSYRLQALFRQAERESGFPARVLEAISYLESWGLPNAESPAGPKGIMQISEATARGMKLQIIHARRYKVVTVTRTVRGKKRTIRTRTPYVATVRDDRLIPERAIPAAAAYLARLENKFGGQDWAIFAYHCGEGCVSYLHSISEMALGTRDRAPTVARMFFGCSPAYNRNLYDAIQAQMLRDFSPTYWFRVMRAQQLLALSRQNPEAFRRLADEYHAQIIDTPRAPNRLSVWLRSADLAYRTSADIRADQGRRLVRVFDNPDSFGFRLRTAGPAGFSEDLRNQDLDVLASPAAIGTLSYVAYETRRLYQEARPGEVFRPLDVTSLVHPLDTVTDHLSPEMIAHSSGYVFDIASAGLPATELECLRFVLDDLGWYGYLGFTEEAPGDTHIHIGCSPASRDFFAQRRPSRRAPRLLLLQHDRLFQFPLRRLDVAVDCQRLPVLGKRPLIHQLQVVAAEARFGVQQQGIAIPFPRGLRRIPPQVVGRFLPLGVVFHLVVHLALLPGRTDGDLQGRIRVRNLVRARGRRRQRPKIALGAVQLPIAAEVRLRVRRRARHHSHQCERQKRQACLHSSHHLVVHR